jgi:ssDNA-binding Zn-finger/Zn-ribbon topoisomerase 1
MLCPRCGYPLKARENSKTGSAFLGCSIWPACSYSSDLKEWNRHPDKLRAEFYISPSQRKELAFAEASGIDTSPRKLVNRVNGRLTE